MRGWAVGRKEQLTSNESNISERSIPLTNDVDQSVEIIRAHYETVATTDVSPSAHHDVTAKRMLQRPNRGFIV